MTMKNFSRLLTLPLVAFILVSCGSTSSLPKEVSSGGRTFSKVLVKNFSTTVTDPKVSAKVKSAQVNLPDIIAGELRQSGQFSSVARTGKPGPQTLVIDGSITNYDDGNAAMRLLVGFAAGNSNFDANVTYSDARGVPLGSIKVDKNSWALGGAVAMTQDAASFIPGAAEKAAKEALKFAKKN